MFGAVLIYGIYCVFGSSLRDIYSEKYPVYFQYAKSLVILGIIDRTWPIVLVICVLPFFCFFSRRERLRKLAEMGATQDVINALPLFRFKKREMAADVEIGDVPENNVEMASAYGPSATATEGENPDKNPTKSPEPKKRRKRRFKLFKFLKKKEELPKEVALEEPPLFLELDEENANCSICISDYCENEQLRQLGCGHHFHVQCIDEWLRINAKCPLCIQDIRSQNSTSTE
jgi:hypothetical protein